MRPAARARLFLSKASARPARHPRLEAKGRSLPLVLGSLGRWRKSHPRCGISRKRKRRARIGAQLLDACDALGAACYKARAQARHVRALGERVKRNNAFRIGAHVLRDFQRAGWGCIAINLAVTRPADWRASTCRQSRCALAHPRARLGNRANDQRQMWH